MHENGTESGEALEIGRNVEIRYSAPHDFTRVSWLAPMQCARHVHARRAHMPPSKAEADTHALFRRFLLQLDVKTTSVTMHLNLRTCKISATQVLTFYPLIFFNITRVYARVHDMQRVYV